MRAEAIEGTTKVMWWGFALRTFTRLIYGPNRPLTYPELTLIYPNIPLIDPNIPLIDPNVPPIDPDIPLIDPKFTSNPPLWRDSLDFVLTDCLWLTEDIEFNRVSLQDLMFTMASIMFVYYYISFYTGTLFIGAMGMLQIILTLPLALFLYRGADSGQQID